MHASWPPSTPPSLGLAKRKSGLRAPSPLNTLTFHLSTHLLPGHRVSPMLRHRSAGDVGNLSGQPNPHFSCLCVCVCVSMRACVCTRGFLQESLSLCRQPRRSQTSQCQWLCKQCRCWSWCIGSWGILVTAIGAIRQPDVTCMPPNTVQHLCPPPLNTYTLHAQTQYTMETIHPG